MSEASGDLAGFERLADTLARMVELARAKQWQELPALDAQCAFLFVQLRAHPSRTLSPGERARVAALVERVQADQETLARLVRPQLLGLARNLRAESAR